MLVICVAIYDASLIEWCRISWVMSYSATQIAVYVDIIVICVAVYEESLIESCRIQQHRLFKSYVHMWSYSMWTYGRVMSIYMNESCQYIWTSHVNIYVSTHMNESGQDIWTSHVNIYERVMSHIWRSHVSHRWMSQVRHMNESLLTYEWVKSHTWTIHITHMKESCQQIWTSHVSHMNKSCVT